VSNNNFVWVQVPDTEGIGLVHRRTGEPYSFSSALDQRVPRTRRRRFKQVDDLLPLDVMENGLFNTECVTLTEGILTYLGSFKSKPYTFCLLLFTDEKAEFDKSEKNNSDGDNACEELDMTAVLMDMDENDLDNPVVCQPSPQFEVTVYIDSKTGKMRRAYTEETLKNVKRRKLASTGFLMHDLEIVFEIKYFCLNRMQGKHICVCPAARV